MRKKLPYLPTILVILIFVLCSCSASDSKTADFSPERAFCVHMSATINEKAFEADITCETYENIKITFTSPEQLTDFSVTLNSDTYTVDVLGVPDTLSKDEISSASPLNVLISALKTAVFTNHSGYDKTENGYEANIEADGIPVRVFFSSDGYITALWADSIGFSALFTQEY